jgi:hypothetical protein
MKATKEQIKLTHRYNELSLALEYFLTVNAVKELKKLNRGIYFLKNQWVIQNNHLEVGILRNGMEKRGMIMSLGNAMGIPTL